MRIRRELVRGGVTIVIACALLFGATRLPSNCWHTIGQTMAMASVTLQRAGQTADLLAERLSRPVANAADTGSSTPEPEKDAGAEQQPMTEPEATQPNKTTTPPENDGSGGLVVEQTVRGGTTEGGIQIKNKSGVSVDIAAALKADLPFQIEFGSTEPQVLIYHTHTTEGYMPYDAGYYNEGDVPRNDTYPYNVVAVGDALEAELTAAGITVIHDTAVYDYPNYRGAYERSVVTMEETLKKYPSIKVTLDIHRDGLMVNSTDKLKPTVTINEKKAAQLMVVCGTLSTDALPHPQWSKNLVFATHLQKTLETTYTHLCRPLSLTAARYNQYVTTGSLLIEVGSEGNTLEEATYSAHLLGQTLVAMWGANS